jgi:uncharacterized glyoxalase superfamily protein PhnB
LNLAVDCREVRQSTSSLDKTEEAVRSYEKALGGKLTEIHRFSSTPQQGGSELTPEQKNLVMHVGLELSQVAR